MQFLNNLSWERIDGFLGRCEENCLFSSFKCRFTSGEEEIADVSFYRLVSLYKDSAKVTWIRGFRASGVDDCRSSSLSSFHSPFHDTWCIKAIEQSTYSIHSQYVQYRNLMKLVWYKKFMIYIIHTDINLIIMPPTFLMYISALHKLALASRSAEALVQQLRALTTSKSDEGGRMSGIGWYGAFLVKVRRFLTKVFMCFSTHNGCGHSLT